MTDYVLELAYDSSDTSMEDVLQSRLFLAGSSGNSSRDEGGTTTVSAYFESQAARDDAADLFRDIPVELSFADRARVDWLDMYQQSLHALMIGTRFVVAPDRALVPRGEERLSIVLPQEQAFGTGSHETTALCMEMLETLDLAGARGLDIGSGSGILAIAMLRLGAARAVAFDNDRDAYAALRDNRVRNGVAEEAMPLFIGGVESLRGGLFDVVTMNIVPEVIVPLLGEVTRRLSEGGTLILSGILLSRRDHVIAAAVQRALTLVGQRDRGEWWCGAFHRDTK